MKEETIEFSLIETPTGFAYDVYIKGDEATLGQYIRGLDSFLAAKVTPCLGCDSCCYQRIPLTLPDIYLAAGYRREDIAAFLAKRVRVEQRGPFLDVCLNQGEEGICTFLDKAEQRCTDHPHRSLVCHSYICLPQTPRARELRENLINEGEDALIAALLHWGLLPQFQEWRKIYPLRPSWQGKTFDQVHLKEVIHPRLWEKLRNPF